MKLNKAYKFRIYPTKKQTEYFEGCFNACRYVYNKSLDCEKQLYELQKFAESFGTLPPDGYKRSNLSAFGLGYHLKFFKINDNWLNNYDSLALEFEMENLSNAFSKFFKGGGFPKFKSKKDSKQSFRTRQKISISENSIKIPKLKTPIFCKVHRKLDGKLKQFTISRENGKYYVSAMVEIEKEITPAQIQREVGIDLGIKNFATFDDGTKIENPSFLREEMKYMEILQQKLARAKKGSNNHLKIKKSISILHERIKNKRSNFLHNTSRKIVNNFDRIFIEDLNIKGMTASAKGTIENPGKNVKQKSGLNRNILDVGMSNFANMLSYKTKFEGKELVKVSRFFASSKICSVCQEKNKNLKLNIREWTCEKCGTVHDRDKNAAQNIKAEGRRSLTIVK